MIHKTIQLYETCNLRFGVALVGPTLGGKTVCYKTLARAMTRLAGADEKSCYRQVVSSGAEAARREGTMGGGVSGAALGAGSKDREGPGADRESSGSGDSEEEDSGEEELVLPVRGGSKEAGAKNGEHAKGTKSWQRVR